MKIVKIKKEDLIESKTGDKEFDNAWESLDIDMGASVMTVQQFDDFMKRVEDLKW